MVSDDEDEASTGLGGQKMERAYMVDFQAVRDAALRWLARREYSRIELKTKLKQRLGASEFIDPVLDDLETNGWLSDERYAASRTRVRSGRGYGPLRIKAELKVKGVNAETVTEALNDQEQDWVSTAKASLLKRFGSIAKQDPELRAKQYRYLLQRGFSSDHVEAVFRTAEEDND